MRAAETGDQLRLDHIYLAAAAAAAGLLTLRLRQVEMAEMVAFTVAQAAAAEQATPARMQ